MNEPSVECSDSWYDSLFASRKSYVSVIVAEYSKVLTGSKTGYYVVYV